MKIIPFLIVASLLVIMAACSTPVDDNPPAFPEETPRTAPNETGVDDLFSEEGEITPPSIPK